MYEIEIEQSILKFAYISFCPDFHKLIQIFSNKTTLKRIVCGIFLMVNIIAVLITQYTPNKLTDTYRGHT